MSSHTEADVATDTARELLWTGTRNGLQLAVRVPAGLEGASAGEPLDTTRGVGVAIPRQAPAIVLQKRHAIGSQHA